MDKFIKFERLMAWVLLFGMILYFVSGYGMSKGIIDRGLARQLHLNYLSYIVLFAFVVHTFHAIHLAFKRWGIWNLYGKIILISFYLLFIASFVFIDQLYTSPKKEVSTEVQKVETSAELNKIENLKEFTVEELAKYNGQDGQSSYVAIDGLVYDLSAVFQSGFHASHFAGKDLTNAFYSRHAKSVLSKYPVIGTLK